MIEENFIGGRASSNRTGWLIGSVSTPIFDAQRWLKTGPHSLSLWPFESFDPRMVCQGECHTHEKLSSIKDYPLTLEITFDTRAKVKWGLKPE